MGRMTQLATQSEPVSADAVSPSPLLLAGSQSLIQIKPSVHDPVPPAHPRSRPSSVDRLGDISAQDDIWGSWRSIPGTPATQALLGGQYGSPPPSSMQPCP